MIMKVSLHVGLVQHNTQRFVSVCRVPFIKSSEMRYSSHLFVESNSFQQARTQFMRPNIWTSHIGRDRATFCQFGGDSHNYLSPVSAPATRARIRWKRGTGNRVKRVERSGQVPRDLFSTHCATQDATMSHTIVWACELWAFQV